MTREEFFNKLKTGAKWDVGVAINRTNPVPLDANEIFESIDAMETYIKSNALAYPGQIVVVLGETETAAYLVNVVGGEGKGYSKLAATTGSGDVGEELTKLANRVAAVEGYFTEGGVAKKATADAAGNVIADTYATKTALFDAEKDIEANATAIGTLETKAASLEESIGTLMPKAGGAFTGAVTVLTPAADMNPATKKYVDDALKDLTGIDFKIVDELPESGEKGIIYLIAHTHGEKDIYDEYIWVGDAFEKIGSTDIDLSDYAKTADLKAAAVAVGAGETIKSISEANGIISVEKQSIVVTQSQVTGLADALAGKQAHSVALDGIAALEGEGLVKKTADGYAVDSNNYLVSADLADYAKSADVTTEINEAVADKQTAAQVNALIAAATIKGEKVDGAVALATTATTANKVANALTVGAETYDGSAPITVTAETLGALTEVPAATAAKIGGFKLASAEEKIAETTATHRLVELDAHNHAYVDIPAAMVYTAKEDGGIELVDGAFGIKEAGVKNSMIEGVSTDKLTQGANRLVLNGGSATE